MRNKNLMIYPVDHYYGRLKTWMRMEWLKKNWFKVALIVMAGSLLLAKDLKFQVDLKAPAHLLNEDNAAKADSPGFSLLKHGRQLGTRLVGAFAAPATQIETVEVYNLPEKEAQAGFSDLSNTYSNMTYVKAEKVSPELAGKIAKQQAYVQRFVNVAQAEMKKFEIPASITLAQGLIESNAGDSRLSREINNHFGMKCFSRTCRKGHCKNFTDDTHKDFFRSYGTAWESYRAHSQMLQNDRYRHLKKYGNDYKTWAHGLKKAGYATDAKYAEKLISLIEELGLDQYDRP